MKRLSAVVVMLLIATTAQAQIEYQDVPDPCAGTMDVDTCFWSPMDGTSGASYDKCDAYAASDQTCQDKVQSTTSTRAPECAAVYRSGSCACDLITRTLTGKCSYHP